MAMMNKNSAKNGFGAGSALILVVVLTSLLAIVGVMFVMAARVNRIATSAISENKELNFAVETIIAEISQKLALDVPGAAGKEYYDYPGQYDRWLASLEPYKHGANDYRWRWISDVYDKWGATPPELQAEIIDDHQPNVATGDKADADGDGVADSKWIELDDITSSKGKPIYAAIRIIDNGGMINVNTAYEFDANDPTVTGIDGSKQTQINLAALRRGTTKPFSNLDNMRKGGEIWDLDRYIDEVIWRIEEPDGLWTPFDISDELKLRNRYILNYNKITTRIEELWTKAYDWGPRVPIPTGQYDFSDWFYCTNNSSPDDDD